LGQETSPEEFVLQELEMAMTQVNEKLNSFLAAFVLEIFLLLI
jgi:hypothetical protein